jgi:hypothetical protein
MSAWDDLEAAMRAGLDEDDAITALQLIPDGWAKMDGKWVQIVRVPDAEVRGPLGKVECAAVLIALSPSGRNAT